MRWIYYPTLRQRWHNIVNLTLSFRRCNKDVMNLTSWFQRCNDVANTTFIAQCELNVLSNDEATLEQCYNFDVVISTSLQRCLLVVQCCNLTTTLSKHCGFAGSTHRAKILLWKSARMNSNVLSIFKIFEKKLRNRILQLQRVKHVSIFYRENSQKKTHSLLQVSWSWNTSQNFTDSIETGREVMFLRRYREDIPIKKLKIHNNSHRIKPYISILKSTLITQCVT